MVLRGNARARLLCGVALAGLALGVGAAQAEDAAAISIPSQPLASALKEFGIQTHQPVLYGPQLADAKTSHAVAGANDASAALAMLLDGTGLTYKKNGETFLIVAGESEGGNVVQELVVTAQKKSENIQVVPIAISAFTQEDLTTRQVAGGPDLMTQVPNMTFTKTNFSSYSIQIRGIGTQAISATTDPGVAVAFNNSPFIQNRFFEQEFYDLERVEVLRGPQGTLYGRNATAGVVNILSAKPKFVYEAKASADVANYSSKRLEGMINIPLVEDKVALRLAGAWTKRDGFVTNELTGNPIDGRDLWSSRLSLRFAPNDRIDANLIWEHFQEGDDRLRSGKQLCKKHIVREIGGIALYDINQPLPDAGQAGWPAQATVSQGCERVSLYSPDAFQTPNGVSVPYYVPLSFIGLPAALLDPYVNQVQSRDLRVIESTVDPIYKAKADLGELQVSWNVTDSLKLASETAYSVDFVSSQQDFNRFDTAPGAWETKDFFGNPNSAVIAHILDENGVFCDPQVGCTDRLVAIDLSTAKSRQFSQEFRLSSDFGGPFNFSLGANFTRFDLDAKYYVFINSLTLEALISNGGGFNLYSSSHPYIPGVSDNRELLPQGQLPQDPLGGFGYTDVYIEPNSIANIQDQGHNYFLSNNPYKLVSYAAFGEVYYNITENLKLTGGLRWTVDRKEAPRIPSWALAGSSAGYPVLQVIDQEWREPTGRLAIDWKPDLGFTDQTLLYASYAHGYKAGGANPPPMTPVGQSSTFYGREHISETRPKTFAPEFVDALELGAKNTLFDGKATLNLAAFYYDYKDYQISEIVDRSAFNRNFDATIWGLEIETDWRPLKNLRLGFKGGYEHSAIADGEKAIDLMDRTAGNTDWILVRPFPTFASSCILPVFLFTPPTGGLISPGAASGGNAGGCELAYQANHDPITNLPYVPNPTVFVTGSLSNRWPAGTYPGFDPESAPNRGEGFFKDLSGNQLPNAPKFTATITADYTLPLPHDWLATLHTDLYWQSQSWWRVFDDNAYDKLHPYFTMNLAAIFTNEAAGWRVMAYVKNIFDRDSITGAFLNSDDTALTTNVFLTEPRIFGVRVTKTWDGGPLLGTFGSRHDGPYPFAIELGGQIQRHDAPNDPVTPSFIDEFSPALSPLGDQAKDLDWGDGREVKLSYRPGEHWRVSLGARFGKTNGGVLNKDRREFGDKICFPVALNQCENGAVPFTVRYNYTISSTADHEEHTIVDFSVGRDFGLGVLDASTFAAGVRYAELDSTTSAHIFGATHWDFPSESSKYPGNGYNTHDRYDAKIDADRSFKGVGPVLSWEASKALLGNKEFGVLGVDWTLSGGVLFGKRKTSISGAETAEYFFLTNTGDFTPNIPTTTTPLPPISIHRSQSATVPTFGLSLGLSYKLDRMNIGAGYRWERYFDAIDGGYAHSKSEDRTIDGPYLKVSVGFGG